VAWGDCDNDGDLDILLTGWTVTGPVSKVYRNDGSGSFTDIGAGLTGLSLASVAWGDYDNDGDLDILLTGADSDWNQLSKVYGNDGGASPAFSDIGAGLIEVSDGSVAWGDYDNDNDLDILLTGQSVSGYVSRVYRNDGASGFTDIAAALTSVGGSSVAWGDVDNDGDLDILLTGLGAGARVSKVYRNDGASGFTDIGAGLTGVSSSSAAWGDADGDGDLDILLTGWTDTARVSRVYRNNSRPKLGSVTPASGGAPVGPTAYFTTTWSDPDGWENLKQCYFHIGASPALAGNVTLLYNAAKDKLWMLNDAGTSWTGGYAPRSLNVMDNSQARVYCADTKVRHLGNRLEVVWAIRFLSGFDGTKKLGLKARDIYKVRAKAAWKGSWTITP
jgi:hypothetical protein